MGTYDTYGKVQLKVGDYGQDTYNVGDNVPIPDGVYVSYEGVVCVYAGIFFAEFPNLHDKYGGGLNLKEILTGRNLVATVIAELLKNDPKSTSMRIVLPGSGSEPS